MAISKISAFFQNKVIDVWNNVTSLTNYKWRSDLSKIEIIDDYKFIEYTKDGYPTVFIVTKKDEYQRLEFDIENTNMKGHWIGVFLEKDNGTEIEFTEEVIAKKIFMKPFVKSFLKKQQEWYIKDLKKALEER